MAKSIMRHADAHLYQHETFDDGEPDPRFIEQPIPYGCDPRAIKRGELVEVDAAENVTRYWRERHADRGGRHE